MEDMRDVFDARKYLQEYFTTPNDEDWFTMQFWVEQTRPLRRGVRVLEYGGGPTLYSVLILARQASSVHFSDYVPNALKEVRKWIAGEPDAHDWRPYTRTILQLEGSPHDEAAVAAREDALRRRMATISEGDATTEQMLFDPRPPYDVVTAHHCLDVAARDFQDFKRMVRRLAEWLAPGGLFLLSVTTGTTQYTVEGNVFACLDLSRAQVCESLVEAGIDPSTAAQAEMAVDREEYHGVLLSAGWKRK